MMRQVAASDALKIKYPEWIDLVVSHGKDGQVNVMPVGWSTIASGSPLLYALAIHGGHHVTRLIRERGEFVVAAPSAGMGTAVSYCGTHSGRDGDKIGPSGLQLVPAARVGVPLLRDRALPQASGHRKAPSVGRGIRALSAPSCVLLQIGVG